MLEQGQFVWVRDYTALRYRAQGRAKTIPSASHLRPLRCSSADVNTILNIPRIHKKLPRRRCSTGYFP